LENLSDKFEIRDYQKEALARFRYYLNSYQGKKVRCTYFFHMATGSVKRF